MTGSIGKDAGRMHEKLKKAQFLEEKITTNIKYHSGFVSGLEVLLWRYREQINIEPEKWLSTEGIRMDVLILKKNPAVSIDFDIGRIFRGHNILEYKRPDDQLNIDIFAKVMAYANLYKSQGMSVDSIPYSDISATIYRHAFPRDFFRKLREQGGTVKEKYSGVYYVFGMSPFPFQILVGRQLDPGEYAMFRVITPGASDKDIRTFKDIAIRNRDTDYQKSVDNIFQVSVSANRETYVRLMKEDPYMCDALKDLMKEDFMEAEAKGGIVMLVNLVKKGLITAEEAAAECNMTEEKFKETYLAAARA